MGAPLPAPAFASHSLWAQFKVPRTHGKFTDLGRGFDGKEVPQGQGLAHASKTKEL